MVEIVGGDMIRAEVVGFKEEQVLMMLLARLLEFVLVVRFTPWEFYFCKSWSKIAWKSFKWPW